MTPKVQLIDGELAKECTGCNKIKKLSEYNKQSLGFLSTHSKCKECYKKYENDRPKRELSTEYRRNRHLKNRYDLTLDEYNKLYKEQQGLCNICGKHFEVLHVDHNHETEIIRGLLCADCNHGLGSFQDSLLILEAAIRYLKWDPTNSEDIDD